MVPYSIWMLVTLDALTERPTLIPSVLRPFAERFYLRPFAFLFTPGWPSGLFFYLLCVVLFALAFAFGFAFLAPLFAIFAAINSRACSNVTSSISRSRGSVSGTVRKRRLSTTSFGTACDDD